MLEEFKKRFPEFIEDKILIRGTTFKYTLPFHDDFIIVVLNRWSPIICWGKHSRYEDFNTLDEFEEYYRVWKLRMKLPELY